MNKTEYTPLNRQERKLKLEELEIQVKENEKLISDLIEIGNKQDKLLDKLLYGYIALIVINLIVYGFIVLN